MWFWAQPKRLSHQRNPEFMRMSSIFVTRKGYIKSNQPACHIISYFNGNCSYLCDKKWCEAQIIVCGKKRECGLANQGDFWPLLWGGELEQGDCWEILQAEHVFSSGPPQKQPWNSVWTVWATLHSPQWLIHYHTERPDGTTTISSKNVQCVWTEIWHWPLTSTN